MVQTRFGVSDAFSASLGLSTAGAVGGEMARVSIASLLDAAATPGTTGSGAGTAEFAPGSMSRDISATGQAVLRGSRPRRAWQRAVRAEKRLGNDLHAAPFAANDGFGTGPHPIVELNVIV